MIEAKKINGFQVLEILVKEVIAKVEEVKTASKVPKSMKHVQPN
jgi:hypothetical protein